jgi:hypothetical protein
VWLGCSSKSSARSWKTEALIVPQSSPK